MPGYTKFSDRFGKIQGSIPTPANPAISAKASPIGYPTTQQEASSLAALAGLAEGRPALCTLDEQLTVIAPQRLSGRLASLQPPDEPPYDRPHDLRRGRIIRSGSSFLHFCVICGAWGTYGYGVATNDQTGSWYCREHRLRAEKR
jgi:hypothetical protein